MIRQLRSVRGRSLLLRWLSSDIRDDKAFDYVTVDKSKPRVGEAVEHMSELSQEMDRMDRAEFHRFRRHSRIQKLLYELVFSLLSDLRASDALYPLRSLPLDISNIESTVNMELVRLYWKVEGYDIRRAMDAKEEERKINKIQLLLNKHLAKRVRRILAKQVPMKRVPEIRFLFDVHNTGSYRKSPHRSNMLGNLDATTGFKPPR